MKKIVVANLKMNLLSAKEREVYLKKIDRELADKKFADTEIVLCPPFVHLEAFKEWKNKKVKCGAQNVFWEDEGSFTGEVSPKMLKNFGCEFVILGHSERRSYLRENDQDVNSKITAALRNKIKIILCIGEDAQQKTAGTEVIAQQLQGCLNGVENDMIKNITICYEPVWAISSNNPDHLPTANEIMSARLQIKKFLTVKYGAEIAEKARIIYGGSVSASNAKEVCVSSGMDGALVGKESLAPSSFIKLVEIINNNQ